MAPVALHLLRFIARRAEAIDDFEDRLAQPLRGNGSAVIELEG